MLLFDPAILPFDRNGHHNCHPRPQIPWKTGITCGSVMIS